MSVECNQNLKSMEHSGENRLQAANSSPIKSCVFVGGCSLGKDLPHLPPGGIRDTRVLQHPGQEDGTVHKEVQK